MAGRLLLTFALVACLLVGCSDGDGSDAEPTSAPSTEDSSGEPNRAGDASPVGDDREAPRLPSAAHAASLRGADAFIRHYVDLLNYAAGTGNIAALHDAATRGCDGCRRYEVLFEETYEDGGYMKDTGWRPTSVDTVRQGDGITVALLTVHAPRMRYKLEAGAEEKIGRSDVFDLRFELVREPRGWVVTDFGLQADIGDL